MNGPRATRLGRTGPLLGAALIAFYILFPLDTGFPTVPVFGRPLNSAVVATLAVLSTLIIQSRWRILWFLREPYCIVQSAYCGMLLLSSLRAESAPIAAHISIIYYCTFVLNYVILRHITRRHGTLSLTRSVTVVAVIAAVIGIVQGMFGVSLPFYDAWFAVYSPSRPLDFTLADVRIAGTLSNPILYGTAMTLSLPYALELRRPWLRALAVAMLVLAAGLSGSRTVLLVMAVLAVGAAVVNRWRVIGALAPICLGFVLLMHSLGGWNAASNNQRLQFLLERLGVRQGFVAASAALTIDYRLEALKEGIRELSSEWSALTWLVGRGPLTSGSVSERVVTGYNTMDNQFFTVLYEQGLVGLTLFVLAFGLLLTRTRRVWRTTLHWYAPIGLLAASVSFNWAAYSTFNILAVGSMALATLRTEAKAPVGGLSRQSARQAVPPGRRPALHGRPPAERMGRGASAPAGQDR